MTALRCLLTRRTYGCAALIVLAGVLVALPAKAMEKKHHTGKHNHVTTNCDIQKGACTRDLGNGLSARLDVLPKPVKAMENLTFTVSFNKPLPGGTAPYIDLNMPAMDMGKNQVVLSTAGERTYSGTGVIVR